MHLMFSVITYSVRVELVRLGFGSGNKRDIILVYTGCTKKTNTLDFCLYRWNEATDFSV
jgi:hypothetical protein